MAVVESRNSRDKHSEQTSLNLLLKNYSRKEKYVYLSLPFPLSSSLSLSHPLIPSLSLPFPLSSSVPSLFYSLSLSVSLYQISTILSQAAMDKLNPSLTTLPHDPHTDRLLLYQLFTRPEWKVHTVHTYCPPNITCATLITHLQLATSMIPSIVYTVGTQESDHSWW